MAGTRTRSGSTAAWQNSVSPSGPRRRTPPPRLRSIGIGRPPEREREREIAPARPTSAPASRCTRSANLRAWNSTIGLFIRISACGAIVVRLRRSRGVDQVRLIERLEHRIADAALREDVEAAPPGGRIVVGHARSSRGASSFRTDRDRCTGRSPGPPTVRSSVPATASIASRMISASSRTPRHAPEEPVLRIDRDVGRRCRSSPSDRPARSASAGGSSSGSSRCSTNSTASQSSSSGCDGGSPILPKLLGVRTMPSPKWCCQRRLTITRAVSGLSRRRQPLGEAAAAPARLRVRRRLGERPLALARDRQHARRHQRARARPGCRDAGNTTAAASGRARRSRARSAAARPLLLERPISAFTPRVLRLDVRRHQRDDVLFRERACGASRARACLSIWTTFSRCPSVR